jgi:glucose-1-phosphate thymidylyltransferase
MKGVILAGGLGTRLMPLTKVLNKHILPVGKKPMIFHPIERLVESGIVDIMIVSSPSGMDSIFNLLGSGSELGCSLTYRVQDSANGIGGALLLCEDFVGESPCMVILGDNIFTENISRHVENYLENIKEGSVFFLREVSDPHRYGVATLDKNNNIIKITEKPSSPDSNLCITGIYIYDSDVFKIIKSAKPSKRGELEITDINNEYIKRNKTAHSILGGMWTDAGTWDSYMYANQQIHNTAS